MNSTTINAEKKETVVNIPEAEVKAVDSEEKKPVNTGSNSSTANEEAWQREKEARRDEYIKNRQKERIDKSNKSPHEKEVEYAEIEGRLKILRAANKDGNFAWTWKDLEVGHNLNQDGKIDLLNDSTMIVGVDIGKSSHWIRAFNREGRELTTKEVLEFSNREEGLEIALRWIENYQVQFGFERVILGMEPTGHYYIDAALYFIRNGVTSVLVNPNAVHASKELDDNSQDKNDRKDPKVIGGLVKDGRFSVPYFPEGCYASLRENERVRIELTENRTAAVNRLIAFVDQHFPEMPEVIGTLVGTTNLLILKECPLPQDIVELGVEGVRNIFRANKLRGIGEKQAMKYVNAAQHSIGHTPSPEDARMRIRFLVDQIELYDRQLEMVKNRYVEIAGTYENLDKVLEIKGIGVCSILDVLAEIGDPSRFEDSNQIFKLAGLVPVSQSSGKHKGEFKISKRGRKYLRKNLFILTQSVCNHAPEWSQLLEYYMTRDKNPLKRNEALIALSHKLLRVILTILKKGCSYDPTKLLSDVKRLQSATKEEKAA